MQSNFFFFVETDSFSGDEDDDCVSVEEDNRIIANGSLNGPEVNILANQYADRNERQDFVEHTGNTRQNDGVNGEAGISENHENTTMFLPLNTSITEDPNVWALANNIGEWNVQ